MVTENEKTDNGVLEGLSADDKMTKLQAELSEAQSKLDDKAKADQTLGSLLSDPEVRAVLAAKQSGKKVTVTEQTEQVIDPEQVLPSTTDLEDMSNTQLAKFMLETIGPAVGKSIQQAVEPIANKVKELDGAMMQTEDVNARKEIERLEKEHPDFGIHKQEILNLMKRNPGLLLRQAYLVVSGEAETGVEQKPKKGDPSPTSERPTHTAARTTKDPNKAVAPGQRGFDALLDDAIGKFDWLSIAGSRERTK